MQLTPKQLRTLKLGLIDTVNNFTITDNDIITLDVFYSLKLLKVKVNSGSKRIVNNIQRLNSKELYIIECQINDYLKQRI